jgi:hypothetical protein
MRGSLTPMLGAIGAGVCLAALTPAMSHDVAPDDVYAWRWTVDTILEAQKKASHWDMRTPSDLRWWRCQSGNSPKSSGVTRTRTL